MLTVRRHYPKRGRFTENLSIYLSSPAPNSLLENPSNFGATASHWLLYILLFFFFLILTGWMRGALCVATHLYILYLAADESISGWEFFLLIPKSPQVLFRRILGWIFFQLNFLGRTLVVDFYLFWLLFLGELHSWSEWRNPSVGFHAISSVPAFVQRVRLVVLVKKEEVTFLCRTVWDYLSFLHSSQNQVLHVLIY